MNIKMGKSKIKLQQIHVHLVVSFFPVVVYNDDELAQGRVIFNVLISDV